mgnify:CR=1 FL=1
MSVNEREEAIMQEEKMHRSTYRVLKIFELLSATSEGMSLTGLAQKLEIPKGSLHPILKTMQAMNFIRMNDNGNYTIGQAAYFVGSSYTKNSDLLQEIDYVLNQKAVESRDFETIEKEMTTIAEFCRKNKIKDKVIVEMCKLDGDEEAKRKVCEIALKAKPVYLKTSTGRSFKGADLNDVKLMKSILKDAVKIKAAGGIHNYEEAKAFIDAGASALGASAGIAIVEGESK